MLKKIKKWLKLLKSDDTQDVNRDELEFLPEALEILRTPPSPVGRIAAWFCIVVMVVLLLWSYFGHIDEVAIARGKIIPSGYTKTIQVYDTGVVKNIRVRDGSKVKAGDVLVELDTTLTEADQSRQDKEASYLRLEIERLLAEQQNRAFQIANAALFKPDDIKFQMQLYESRIAEYRTKRSILQKAIEQAHEEVRIAENTVDKLKARQTLAVERESSMRKLLEVGAVSKFQYWEYLERSSDLEKDIAMQINAVSKARQNLLQSMETLQNTTDAYQKDIMTQLVTARRELHVVEEELKKAQEKLRLSTIVAPIDGTVQGLAVHTVGGVVTSAQALMMVVPDQTSVEVEAWVENKDIGFVYPGQDAEIKVDTFNFQKYGVLEAKLVEVGSDAIDDKERGLIYRVLLRTKEDKFHLANGRDVPLTPGMAVTAEIKTRQKRIIEYFTDPFVKYIKEGLRER